MKKQRDSRTGVKGAARQAAGPARRSRTPAGLDGPPGQAARPALTVGEIMKSPVTTAKPSDTAADLIDLTRRHRIRHFPVLENDQLVGIVTDRNLREATTHPRVFSLILDLIASMDRLTVQEIMTHEVVSATPETPLSEAARLMVDRKVGCLPVVKDGRLVGILTHDDLLDVFAVPK